MNQDDIDDIIKHYKKGLVDRKERKKLKVYKLIHSPKFSVLTLNPTSKEPCMFCAICAICHKYFVEHRLIEGLIRIQSDYAIAEVLYDYSRVYPYRGKMLGKNEYLKPSEGTISDCMLFKKDKDFFENLSNDSYHAIQETNMVQSNVEPNEDRERIETIYPADEPIDEPVVDSTSSDEVSNDTSSFKIESMDFDNNPDPVLKVSEEGVSEGVSNDMPQTEPSSVADCCGAKGPINKETLGYLRTYPNLKVYGEIMHLEEMMKNHKKPVWMDEKVFTYWLVCTIDKFIKKTKKIKTGDTYKKFIDYYKDAYSPHNKTN